jgi:hypothetical protein
MLVYWILGMTLFFENIHAGIDVHVLTVIMATLNSWNSAFLDLGTILDRVVFIRWLVAAVGDITIIGVNRIIQFLGSSYAAWSEWLVPLLLWVVVFVVMKLVPSSPHL